MFQGTKLYGFHLNMLPLSTCHNPPDAPGQVLTFYCVGMDDTQFITNNKFDNIVSTKYVAFITKIIYINSVYMYILPSAIII